MFIPLFSPLSYHTFMFLPTHYWHVHACVGLDNERITGSQVCCVRVVGLYSEFAFNYLLNLKFKGSM